MIKIRYEIKSKEIGKLQNDPEHIHNVQIVLIDKKMIWVRKDGTALSRKTGNSRNRWKNSVEKMGKGVQKRTSATLAFILREIHPSLVLRERPSENKIAVRFLHATSPRIHLCMLLDMP